MKLRHIVLFLLAFGVTLFAVATPVSAQLNVVQQGGTVLLGEEGLDVTAAVGGADYLGWWSGSDYSTPAARTIDLEGYNLEQFNIDDGITSPFVGTEGKGAWWRLNTSGEVNPTVQAFSVVAPQSNLRVKNLHDGSGTPTDVTDGTALIRDILDFELNPSTLHHIFLRDTGETFNCKIVLRSPNGVTYSKLWTPSSVGAPDAGLTYLPVDSSPWYWSSGDGVASDFNYGWKTDALDPVTSSLVYSPGEYQVTIQCNQNNLGFVGTTKTITLEEEQPTITADPSSLIRGEKFFTTITGIPGEHYLLWIKDCTSCPNACCDEPMSGECCDQPPYIVAGQEGVTFNHEYDPFWVVCPPTGDGICEIYDSCWECGSCGQWDQQGQEHEYTVDDTLIESCGCLCAERLYDWVPPDDPENGRYYFALVEMDENGERTVEWQTTTCTAPSAYKIHTNRWIQDDVCELDLDRPYAEACVDVQQGVVTINTEVCGEVTDTSYLGETVRIYGTNTDSSVTYLFFRGPCQSCFGEDMTATNVVENWVEGTFTQVPVKSDGTWEYYWYTRNLQIDLGEYTIYAASHPNDAPTLEGVPCSDCDDAEPGCAAWAKKAFMFLEPYLDADISPKILKIVCCEPVPIRVSGEATGLRGQTKGADYGTIPIGIWVFGENKVAGEKYIFEPVEIECSTGEFSINLADYLNTLMLQTGTYTVVVQHPMYNHRLDIIPETWICDQSDPCFWLKFDPYIMMDEVWYPDINKKFVVTASPVRWSKLFIIDGPDRLVGTQALNALLTGFADPNIDDKVKVLNFKVESNTVTIADFSGMPTTGAAPLTVQFTDFSSGLPPTAWLWNFGDGVGTSTVQHPSYTYQNPGTYDVTLTVTGPAGSSSVTKNGYVTVGSGPTPTVSPTVSPTPGTSEINLKSGWNFISTPKRLADGHNTAGVLFGGVDTGGRSIFLYDAETGMWDSMSESSPVKPLDGIWIYSVNPVNIPLTYKTGGADLPPTKLLYQGWNAIGFSDTTSVSARMTLLSVNVAPMKVWSQAIGYNAATQSYESGIFNAEPSYNTLMHPTKGYWLYMNGQNPPWELAAISA